MEPTAASTSSTDALRVPQKVAVGRVVGAHGMCGQLRIQYFTDTPEALCALTQVWLTGSDAAAAARAFRVEACAPGRSGELRVSLESVTGREAATALVGQTVAALAADLPPPGDAAVYGFELLGFRAETAEGRWLGEVRGIWNTGAPPLLVIAGEGGREHLVPSALLLRVERDARCLVVDAIPGLIEDPA